MPVCARQKRVSAPKKNARSFFCFTVIPGGWCSAYLMFFRKITLPKRMREIFLSGFKVLHIKREQIFLQRVNSIVFVLISLMQDTKFMFTKVLQFLIK
jgi:hypothetical protein